MKYMTKERLKKYGHFTFPMELEIIDRNEQDLEKIFLSQYQKEFNRMKKANRLQKENEEKHFEIIFNNHLLECTKHFFDNETLSKVADIRLLALGKVFKEEYDFIEKEVMEKDLFQAYNKVFKKIKDKIPPNIYENLSLHDSLIKNIIKEKNMLIIELDCSGSSVHINNIMFEDYEIIEEEMSFINGWWLYEEIYIVNNQYEIHAIIDVPQKNKSKLGYFTIRAKNIILK